MHDTVTGTTRPTLLSRVVMAMPLGPPYGGMTSNSAVLRRSAIFDGDRATLLDTTPHGSGLTRLAHSARRFRELRRMGRRDATELAFFSSSRFLGFYEKAAMALMCRRMGVATVVHIVGSIMEFRDGAHVLERPLIDYFVRSFDRVLVVADRFQAYLAEAVPEANVRIVPNPIECVDFPVVDRPRNAPKTQFLYAGAVVEGKGVFDLIDAVALARDQLENATFVMIGNGVELEECRRRISSLGLENLMTLRGFVDESEKRRLFQASDVFVLPSHIEAL